VVLIGGGGTIVLYWVVRALRWRVLLKKVGVEVPFLDLYMCTAVSLSFALFTPVQSGEALKIELLKKHGMMGRSPGYGSFFVERVADLFVVVIIAAVSMAVKFSYLLRSNVAYIVLAVLAGLVVLGILALRRMNYGGKVGEFINHIRSCTRDFWTLAVVLLLTCLAWSLVGISWLFFLRGISIDLSFAGTMALMSIVTIINILSLIPGGLGVSEVGVAKILIDFGNTAAAAQAGALIIRSYGILAAILGAVHLLLWTAARARDRSIAKAGGETR
jgi:uncharacterized membrane protein YbhN (UPF0104 family)